MDFLKPNYYALFISIVKNVSINEALNLMGIKTKGKPRKTNKKQIKKTENQHDYHMSLMGY